MLACRCRLAALFVSSNLLLFSLYFECLFWIFERQIRSLPPKFMCLYFVVAIGLLLPRRRFGVVNLRLVFSRPPLASSYPTDFAPPINGALFSAGLCIFSAQSLWAPPRSSAFGYAHPFGMIDNFRLICFSSSLLALDLLSAP